MNARSEKAYRAHNAAVERRVAAHFADAPLARPAQARQATLHGTGPDVAGMLRRRADAPLRPGKVQSACDVGLFGDEAAQLDLVDMARRA